MAFVAALAMEAPFINLEKLLIGRVMGSGRRTEQNTKPVWEDPPQKLENEIQDKIDEVLNAKEERLEQEEKEAANTDLDVEKSGLPNGLDRQLSNGIERQLSNGGVKV